MCFVACIIQTNTDYSMFMSRAESHMPRLFARSDEQAWSPLELVARDVPRARRLLREPEL